MMTEEGRSHEIEVGEDEKLDKCITIRETGDGNRRDQR